MLGIGGAARTPGVISQREKTHANIVNSPFCLRRNSRVAVWNPSVFPSDSKPMILSDPGFNLGRVARGTDLLVC